MRKGEADMYFNGNAYYMMVNGGKGRGEMKSSGAILKVIFRTSISLGADDLPRITHDTLYSYCRLLI